MANEIIAEKYARHKDINARLNGALSSYMTAFSNYRAADARGVLERGKRTAASAHVRILNPQGQGASPDEFAVKVAYRIGEKLGLYRGLDEAANIMEADPEFGLAAAVEKLAQTHKLQHAVLFGNFAEETPADGEDTRPEDKSLIEYRIEATMRALRDK